MRRCVSYNFLVKDDGNWDDADLRADILTLEKIGPRPEAALPFTVSEAMREQIKAGVAAVEASLRAQGNGAVVRSRIVGVNG